MNYQLLAQYMGLFAAFWGSGWIAGRVALTIRQAGEKL